MNPRVSIIIPCYNSGNYLPEALASVESYPDKSIYEVIIIDDGSTDEHTISLLRQLEQADNNYLIIHQQNKGCGGARNAGIRSSKGEYLLFLDCDNRIKPEYIDVGISVLDKMPDVGVVYSDATFFGNSSKVRFFSQDFDMLTLLIGNYIDICTVIRRSVWESIGGFEESRVMLGHEDWEFWIRASDKGWKFHHENKILFDYRVEDISLIMKVNSDIHLNELKNYVYQKNALIVARNYTKVMELYKADQLDKKYPFRTFLKHLYQKYLLNEKSTPKMPLLSNTILKTIRALKKTQ